jgi:hypothetical protein
VLHQSVLRANLELHPGEKFTVEDLLKENGLSKLAIPTVYRWIRRLGFKYQVRKKCYYVDTHEKPEELHPSIPKTGDAHVPMDPIDPSGI